MKECDLLEFFHSDWVYWFEARRCTACCACEVECWFYTLMRKEGFCDCFAFLRDLF